MGTPFKMKGSPMARNFGIGSPLHDEKVVKGGTKSAVTVSDKKSESGRSKWARVKSETNAMKGEENKRLANISKEYGGTWKTEDRSKKGGSKSTYVNAEGLTPLQIALKQNKKYKENQRQYKADNTTS